MLGAHIPVDLARGKYCERRVKRVEEFTLDAGKKF